MNQIVFIGIAFIKNMELVNTKILIRRRLKDADVEISEDVQGARSAEVFLEFAKKFAEIHI